MDRDVILSMRSSSEDNCLEVNRQYLAKLINHLNLIVLGNLSQQINLYAFFQKTVP